MKKYFHCYSFFQKSHIGHIVINRTILLKRLFVTSSCLTLICGFSYGQELKTIDYTFPINNKTYPIEVVEYEDYYLYQGDIRLSKNDKKGLHAQGAGLWTCGEIPILYDASISAAQRLEIEDAITYLNATTKLTVFERTNESAYVRIQSSDSGCYSTALGKTGGEQVINLGAGCIFTGIIIHEIFHAAGVAHEQSRSDRDNFVSINFNNIDTSDPNNVAQFNTIPGTIIGSYDFESLMHYGEFAFCDDCSIPTITTLNGEDIGQRSYLSVGDINTIAQIYPCGNLPPNPHTNVDCGTAIDLTGCDRITTSDITTGNGATAINADHALWYTFTSPTTGNLDIFSCGADTDTRLWVYSGSCGNLNLISNNDDGCGTQSEISNLSVAKGQEIFVEWDDRYSSDAFNFSFIFSDSNPPTYNSTQDIEGDGTIVHVYPSEVADFNGDNNDDLVFYAQDATQGLIIRTKLSNGDGSFDVVGDLEGDGSAIHNLGSYIGDFNGDGLDDILFLLQVTGEGLYTRTKLSNGDGTFNAVIELNGSGTIINQFEPKIGDIDGDGDDDIIFAFPNSSLNIRTLISDGDGSYTTAIDILGDGNAIFEIPFESGDFNGDNKSDLLFFLQTGSGLQLRTKISNGDGSFTSKSFQTGFGGAIHSFDKLIGDINGDNKDDIISFFRSTGVNIRTMISNGDGSYQFVTELQGDGGALLDNPYYVGDFNGDNNDDVLFRIRNAPFCGLNLRVKYSIGDGTYCSDNLGSGDGNAVDIYPSQIGDYNGDGISDLALIGQNFGGVGTGLAIRTKLFTGAINNTTCVFINNCPPDFEGTNKLTGTLSVDRDYITDGLIESEQILIPNNNSVLINYDSGTAITLLNNFDSQLGVTFHAFINGCN